MAGDVYCGSWARCDCNLGGRVVSSGVVVWITPKWVVPCKTCLGGPCGPKMGAVADPLIMAADLVGWKMRLLWGRYEMVTSSKS